MNSRLLLALAGLTALLVAALGLPNDALAQPAGTVCAASTDTSTFDNGALFTAEGQNTVDLDVASCVVGPGTIDDYAATSLFVAADQLLVVNNVLNADNGFTAGISVVGGVNVTNFLLNGVPYTSGTQIPLTTAGAFSGIFQFDFGGGSFQFSVVKPAASNTIQGFTIVVAGAGATDLPSLTQRAINNFMVRRADQIIANGPDIAARQTGGFGAATGSAVAFHATGNENSFDVAFATGVRRIQSANAPGDGPYIASAAAAANVPPSSDALMAASSATGFDLWAEGALSRLDNGNASSDLALLHVGADYRFSEDLLIGLLGQIDWSEEENNTMNVQVDGVGWMTGPYLAARVHEHLIFDARAAWGRSHNSVSPNGTYTDSFSTRRRLASGGLTGDIRLDNWHLTPGVQATYFRERQDTFTNSLGVAIPEQTLSLGQFTFGPEAAYVYRPTQQWVMRPQIGVVGIWNFAQADIFDLATGATAGTDDLRVRSEGGLSVTYNDRYTLMVRGFYDGIAVEDFEAYGGRLAINILLASGFVLTGESFMESAVADDQALTIDGTDPAANIGTSLSLRLRL